MAQWLLPALITAVGALLTAFGIQAYKLHSAREDEEQKEIASGSAAKLGADAKLLGMLLDRIGKLEQRLDENAQRSQERQLRIEHLENDRDGCKRELEKLMADHVSLKERFERELGHLVEVNSALKEKT